MLGRAVKVAILAVVVFKVAKLVLDFGFFNHYKKHYPGECRQVKGLNYGAEDLQVTKNGLAFISSGFKSITSTPDYDEFLKTNNIQGSVYLLDFNKLDQGAKKLQIKSSKSFNLKTFHPHGISLLEDEAKGEHLLYVINHPDGEDDKIEKFRYLPETNELVHLKSFSSDKLQITNDLALTGEDRFYITNYLYFKNHFLSLLEQIFIPFGLGSLVYFNGTDFTLVDPWLNSPNGIILSRDKRYLYLDVPLANTVDVYEIKEDKSVVKVQSVGLHTFPDNLHLSQSGDALFIGAHPLGYKILQHLQDPKQQAPSSVLKLPLKDGKVVPEDITELFYDHGDLISGSTVAAVYNNKLVIGSVINKLVICDVNTKI